MFVSLNFVVDGLVHLAGCKKGLAQVVRVTRSDRFLQKLELLLQAADVHTVEGNAVKDERVRRTDKPLCRAERDVRLIKKVVELRRVGLKSAESAMSGWG